MDATALRSTALAALDRRDAAGHALAGSAAAVAQACHAMAERFHSGGKLLVFGTGGACADAQHVAVEFVHPVIVGKRALPALALTGDVATLSGVATTEGWDDVFAHQLRHLGAPADIALGICARPRCGPVLRGLEVAHALGMATIALAAGTCAPMVGSPAIGHLLTATSDDPLVTKEVQVTTYHVLWELVHVFLEQPGLMGPEVLR